MSAGVREFETFRLYDPEIVAHVAPEVAGEYAEHRDAGLLGLPSDARPMVFRCKRLTRTQRNRLQEISAQKTQLVAAFRYGLIEIRDIPQPDGTRTSWSPKRSKSDADQFDERGLDDLEAMGIGDTDWWEIGGVIVAQSFLAHGAPVYVPQLPSSQLAWVAVRSKCLAAQRTDSETRSDG